MQKKDDGDTVSNASKIKLDRTSVIKRENQAAQTKAGHLSSLMPLFAGGV
jgi:hypothetical protein